jgi:glyoxylase-like metal-dependent hydrolase (beta-lactamase superfamily II)
VSTLHYETLTARRPGVTRDLPPGNPDLRWVANSATLIHGDTDAVLVDTFTSIEHNELLVDWVRDHGRDLKYIVITHGHGDHFFGIKQLLEAFPGARAIASPGAAAASRQQGRAEYIETFWNRLFPGQIPQPQVFPEPTESACFDVEGHTFELLDAGFTDTADSNVLWVPDLRLLVAGDVAYNEIHMYTAETTAASRSEWIATLRRLEALDPAHVVAGHKQPGLEDDPAILDASARYLTDFSRLSEESATPEEFYAAMLALHPQRANPGALWGGAKAAFAAVGADGR